MKLREAPLPPDLQYVLDDGVEHGTLTGGAHIAMWLYGSIDEIDRISNAPREERGWAGTAAMCRNLESYGQSLIDQMEPELAAAARGATTASFLHALADHADWIASQSFEDAVWGGCMIHYHRARLHRDGRVETNLARKLESSAFVRRAVDRHRSETGLRHLIGQWDRLGRKISPVSREGFDLLDATLQDQRNRANRRWREWAAAREKPVPPKVVRRQRRAVVRAASIAAAVLGASTVSAFAQGEPVHIPAGDISIEVALSGPIHAGGHGALRIRLADGSARHLSGLCLYQEAPALDQLASLALHAKAGAVGDLIKAGNLYNTAAEAYSHPLLAEKKPKPAVSIDDIGRWADTHVARHAMIQEYAVRRRDAFGERVFIVALGRDGPTAWRMWKSIRERRS